MPTKSFKRFREARKYAQSVFGELTKVENSKETVKKENSPVAKKTSNGIAVKASDDKKLVTGEINGKKFKIDMGKIKIGKDGKTIRDSNSEPLFLIAEQYHKEAEKKFPETKKKIFDNVCAKYGLTTALKNLQGEKLTNPSIKSISSFADRIKRNIVEKGNADPNILKDMIRGTYSFNEKSAITKPNGLKDLVSDLQKISAKPIKLDAKTPHFTRQCIST